MHEEVHGVGNKGSRDTITVDVQTPLEAILIMSPKIRCFLLVKSKISGLETTLLHCWVIWLSKLLDVKLKEFCCTEYQHLHKTKIPVMFVSA
jgi:hypothetical protein